MQRKSWGVAFFAYMCTVYLRRFANKNLSCIYARHMSLVSANLLWLIETNEGRIRAQLLIVVSAKQGADACPRPAVSSLPQVVAPKRQVVHEVSRQAEN